MKILSKEFAVRLCALAFHMLLRVAESISMQKCFINLRTYSGGSSDVILRLKEAEIVS